MADHCNICDTRRPINGTKIIVLNGGATWIEFCEHCADHELRNEKGEVFTVEQIFNGDKNPLRVESAEDMAKQKLDFVINEAYEFLKYQVYDMLWYADMDKAGMNIYQAKFFKEDVERYVAWGVEQLGEDKAYMLKGIAYKAVNKLLNEECKGVLPKRKHKVATYTIGEMLKAA